MLSSDHHHHHHHHHHHNSSAAAVILAIEVVEELLLPTLELWSEHSPCMFNYAEDEGNGKADTSADEGVVDLIIILVNNDQAASAAGYSPSSKNIEKIQVRLFVVIYFCFMFILTPPPLSPSRCLS
jgi:hypothetical protein